MQPDGILQAGGAHAFRGELDKPETVGRPDAAAHQQGSPRAQMVEHRKMIRGVRLPSVRRADRRARSSRIALVYRDGPEIPGEFNRRIEGALVPEIDARAHPPRSE